MTNSWGNYPVVKARRIVRPYWVNQLDCLEGDQLLAYGRGRSYGDSCLTTGTLIKTEGLSRFIELDTEKGLLRCESGVTFSEILEVICPLGWTLPVMPGTQYVTVGGAIANDVHGKNHHIAGTIGCHVSQFALQRSTGEILICSPTSNADYYRATIGGLGLTGLILWAEIKLKPISSALMDVKESAFGSIDDFLAQMLSGEAAHDYSVAWLDTLFYHEKKIRGILSIANHAENDSIEVSTSKRKCLSIPCAMPKALLNPLTIRLFNKFYYQRKKARRMAFQSFYQQFFFPLDAILNWNRLYGRDGFFQYQCVIPFGDHLTVMNELLSIISKSKAASFLSVLKLFSDKSSPGLMSFPMHGITLALDFPNRGRKSLRLLDALDQIVIEAGGRVYIAKDARMSAKAFRCFYPQWEEFAKYIDSNFSSVFWKRVTSDV